MVLEVALEYLQQIREQEELAGKIRQDGLTESKRIVGTANDEAAALIFKARSDADRLYDEAIANANTAAQEDYERTIEQAKWECDMLTDGARKKSGEAVSLIVKRLAG